MAYGIGKSTVAADLIRAQDLVQFVVPLPYGQSITLRPHNGWVWPDETVNYNLNYLKSPDGRPTWASEKEGLPKGYRLVDHITCRSNKRLKVPSLPPYVPPPKSWREHTILYAPTVKNKKEH